VAERIANIYAELSVRADKFNAGLKSARGGLDGLKRGLSDTVREVTGMDLSSLSAAAAVGGLAVGLRYAGPA
jgi:hypothetical protein